jgi:hypothetical protein
MVITTIRPMSRMKESVMQESRNFSQVCASALLDAYCRNDGPQMSEIAADVRMMGKVCTTNTAESERLELLSGIAVELHRSSSAGETNDLDAYVRLLLHLAHPEWIESCFGHND